MKSVVSESLTIDNAEKWSVYTGVLGSNDNKMEYILRNVAICASLSSGLTSRGESLAVTRNPEGSGIAILATAARSSLNSGVALP